jgi:hypothetical protein
MDTFLQAVDNNGELLYGDFPEELHHVFLDAPEGFTVKDVFVNGRTLKSKLGVLTNKEAKLFVFTSDPKYVKSSKLFKELIRMSRFTLESIVKVKNKLSLDHNSYVQDLVHNLTSLNTYNIQDLFALIPQHILTQNINKQHDIIKNILVEQPNIAVATLLKLIKYNLAMKVEFSVFEKTIIQNPFLQKQNLSIKQITLSVLQIFIEDFEGLKITVSVDSTTKMLNVDYDTLFVSLYYLLENAVKYSLRGSKFGIIFKEEPTCFSIIFKMISARIEEHEKNKLCTKNFRAASAILLTNEGKGIGMSRILKTLKMNDAEIEIFPRVTDYQKSANGILYEHNEFKIKFPGQQDWFKVNQVE